MSTPSERLRALGITLPGPPFPARMFLPLRRHGDLIYVSGQTPLVDTQNLTQQRVISRELLSAVPTSQSMLGIASLMPSVVQPPNAQDVGGSMGERSVRISIHGARTTDARLRQEGMVYNGLTPGTNYGSDGLEGSGRGYYVNPLAVNEILIDAGTMEEAVLQASQQARTGDAVLMSPACASFDMFDNYGHRARVFRDAVAALAVQAGMPLEGAA